MDIPVYVFTGFLEAGKTTLIQETMQDEQFNVGEPTLILLCEEGEESYDPSLFPQAGAGVSCRVIDAEDRLTPDRLEAMRKRAGAERVLIEYNGMWQIDNLYRALPPEWQVVQEVMVADSRSILTYDANMRRLVVDKLTGAAAVIFNRTGEHADKMALHKLVRGVSRRANIAYEDTDGRREADQIEDPLPFDINAEVIDIADRDYAIWYRDIVEEMDKYDGKTVRLKGVVAKSDKMPPGTFAIGREVMTCCQDDITYHAFLAVHKKADRLRPHDWLTITARVSIKHHPFYKKTGPVLTVLSLAEAEPPVEPVATFY
ncbi:MAG: GTP-binding protein [Eubacteriales bacterium]